MTPTDIEKLKELEAKATPGPWRTAPLDPHADDPGWFVREGGDDRYLGVARVSSTYRKTPEIEANAAFIAASREAVPSLIAALEAAQADHLEYVQGACVAIEAVKREAKASLEAKDAEIERLRALVSSSEAERYAKCGELLSRAEAAEAALKEAREGLEKIAAPAPTAAELGVPPGMDYWSTVATRRQDIARALLRSPSTEKIDQ